MPDRRTESYEAVPRRPEQQETEGPALSMALCSLFICYHVSYYKQLVYPSTRLPVNLPRYLISNIPCPCLSPLLLPEPVHLLPCLSHTMSYLSPLLLIEPVHLLPCLSHTLFYLSPLLLPELVHLLLCLSHTMSPYPPYPVPLSSLPCPYPVTKKVKPYSFTFFFFPLLSLLIRSRAVTTKTYFVCPP